VEDNLTWELATNTVSRCITRTWDTNNPVAGCFGHEAKGQLHRATGKAYTEHLYSDWAAPLTQLFNSPNGFPDQHGSWHQSGPFDLNPAFMASAATAGSQANVVFPYPVYWYDEIIANEADGQNLCGGGPCTFRFAHTFNSGFNSMWDVLNAIGIVSQDGNYMSFASDWGLTLGKDSNGNQRGDVFIIKLK
jgi:hypothetical protein